MELMEQTTTPERLIDQALALINQANNIILIGHINPDGDAVGSILALGSALQRSGKHVQMILPDAIPALLSFLPGYADLLAKPEQLSPADLIIALDCSDLARMGDVYTNHAALFQSTPILNIDHHYSNERYGSLNWIDSDAAATAEPTYQLLTTMGAVLDLTIATCLLTAIVSDTRCFRTSNTTARTMKIATALMEAGAPLSQIGDWLYNSKKLSTLQLWTKVLGTLESSAGLVWAEVTPTMLQEAGAQPDETDDLVSFIGGIRDAQVSLLFHVHKNPNDNGADSIRVSMRSSGEVNVGEIAAHFGGGGHPRAAGCSLTGDLDNAKETILTYLRRSMARPQVIS
jgi:phosphoesterase RecJ-like protein